MKIRNVIFLTLTAAALFCCKKDKDEPSYDIDEVVLNNSKAAKYYHVIFGEAENAWALVNNKNYSSEPIVETVGASTKSITFKETNSELSIVVDYNVWSSGTEKLTGTLTVILPAKIYPLKDKPASTTLSNFSVNGQRVVGTSTFTYRVVEGDEKYHYDYTLVDGAVYPADESIKERLITSAISSGQYVRIGGGDTPSNDDVWTFNTVMTGILYDDPDMTYTNTILPSETYTIGDQTIAGIVNFSPDCPIAKTGISQIAVPGWTEVKYAYNCSAVGYISQKDIDK